MIFRSIAIVTLLLALASPVLAWERFVGSTAFEPRDSAQGFIFRDRLWLSNGWTHSGVPFRDLWSSKDGAIWREEVAETPYDAYSAMGVLNGAIYAVNRSVWKSNDGKSWQKIGKSPIERDNALPYLQPYRGKLYLFVLEGVWSSSDGMTWVEVPTPETLKRASYAVEEFNGAIFVMGGARFVPNVPAEAGDPKTTSFNDVWKFTEEGGWELATASAAWSPRMWPGSVVHKGRLFLVGGYSNRENKDLAGTWVTEDGVNWDRYDFPVRFLPRHYPTLFSRGGDILLVAGNARPVQNDVWKLDIE